MHTLLLQLKSEYVIKSNIWKMRMGHDELETRKLKRFQLG